MSDPVPASRAFVSLIGAGPGDPGLLTLHGARALREADVVLFDYLANPDLLRFAPDAETIYVGKKGFSEYISQEQINALIVVKAQEGGGRRVARLKGGDVYVFGRGGEEAEACAHAGIPFEVVPGVSSAIAAPAYAGIPVTHREIARSFAVLTGNTREGGAHYERLSGVDTLVLLMGVRNLEQIAAELIAAGRHPDTPAATIQWGSTPQQRTVTGTLTTIAQVVRDAGLEAPAVTVVGEVVRLREQLRWFDLAAHFGGPLAGKTVAVTRTREGASALGDVLRARGASVLEVPLIRFAPTADTGPVADALHDFEGWLLLTSNQAVTALFAFLEDAGLDARALARAKLAAVGPSTARSLAERGLRADFVPDTPGARHLGAQLPARPGEATLHLTSQLAEDDLERALAARGIGYARAELYRTEPAVPTENVLQRLKEAAVVTLASGSAARHLAALATADFDPRALPVTAMGPQTADAARAAGFTRITVADTASLEALADAAERAVRPD
ncbi:uroporphyrinogen III methyltransferase/synthase [Deinococcus metalli]|uniref:uroporphyrinogen-III C-methyltransferase n=1 Tax=Deinococcus metalli TaxID=1141878 RepID=A0A7W8KDN1_9DEIO|nr:uroporphyrinogen-III C-methyltransferase [Deinococcus metalli]MBB5376262.1 uroporphyrinogen III methyltransferase/synthase [Deinococcus metalli]GHF39633.1 uroporphyrinogen-III C-methyltransferase [Deinococcus metalli]